MVVQCCLCERIRKGKEWVNPSASDVPSGHVSHGYCPSCAAAAFAEIRELAGTKRLASTRVATS